MYSTLLFVRAFLFHTRVNGLSLFYQTSTAADEVLRKKSVLMSGGSNKHTREQRWVFLRAEEVAETGEIEWGGKLEWEQTVEREGEGELM